MNLQSQATAPIVLLVLCGIAALPARADDEAKTTEKIIPAEHAREHVNKKGTFELVVKLSKNAIGRKVFYLDSEEDFHDEKNLAIVISYDHAAGFQKVGIDNPAEHYKGKRIRVTGKVIEEEDQIRIHVEDPKQIVTIDASAKPK